MKDNRHGKFRTKSPDPPVPLHLPILCLLQKEAILTILLLLESVNVLVQLKMSSAVFVLKENIDNALDFSEVNFPSSSSGNPEIFVDVMYNQERNCLVIRVRKSNFGLKDIGFTEERIHAIFDDLDRFHSSKRNLFKLSRGLQGDALKEEVGIPYALGSKYNGKEGWNEPLIIRNGNGDEFEVRAVVDKIEGRNYCNIVKKMATANNTFTEIETHLPYNNNIISFTDIKLVLIKYALLNTHITFHFDIVTSINDNEVLECNITCNTKAHPLVT